MAQAADNNDDDEKKQPQLAQHEIDFMAELDDITEWLYSLTDEDEIKSVPDSPRSFFNRFRDGKYLCHALEALVPKLIKGRKYDVELFARGCNALLMSPAFMIRPERLNSKQDMTFADYVDILCNIYALYARRDLRKAKGMRQGGRSRLNIKMYKRTESSITGILTSPVQTKSFSGTYHIQTEEELEMVQDVTSIRSADILPYCQFTDLPNTYVGRVNKAGRLHGFGKLTFGPHNTGGVYAGQFENGEMHGWGVLEFVGGRACVFKGQWNQGKFGRLPQDSKARNKIAALTQSCFDDARKAFDAKAALAKESAPLSGGAK